MSASDERTSRVAIKNGLQTAATEITALQDAVANISGGGNFTGITDFTDGGGFTGNVTGNNLSLTLQYANATQDGQITSSKFTEWTNKGSSNLTVGNTSIHAFAGDLGAGAVSNITTLQGDLTNHTNNISNPHNVTKTQIGLSNVTDVAPLELPISNLTQTALNAKQATLVSATNIKTINGASILGSGDMIITGGGNISGIAGFTDGGGFTGTVTNNSLSLIMQYANATQDGQITSGKFTDWENKGSSNLTLGNTTGTAFDGALGIAAHNHTLLTDNPHGVTKAQVGLGNVSDVISLELPVSNATQIALDLKADKSIYINGLNLSSNITLTTANVSDSSNKRYITDSQLVNVTNLTGTNTGDQNITLSGDISGTGTGNITATLATVNSNVGSFGNATIVPTIVFNGKGLATSVSNNTIPTANTSVGGLLIPSDWNAFYGKGTSNITVGNTTGTAFDGALGAGATSNITTLQGNVTNLTTDVNALNSAMRYIGGWDASTGAFPASTQAGYVYSVTVDGTVDGIDFVATDRLLSILDNASTTTYAGNWLKEDYTDKVISVNGQVGTVSLTTANITASTDNNYVTDAMLSKINQTAANSNVTYVQGNGTVNGLTLVGNVTSGGNLTLGGNLSGVNLSTQITGTLLVANGGTGVATSTGSGSVVLSTSPNLTTPILGTPASGNLTNCTGYPITGVVTANATGVTTLTANGTTSAQLAASLTDETGTGSNVFNTNCTLVTPALGTPSAVNLTNAVGLPTASPTYLGAYDVSGWFALGACAYVSADSPTFVMNMTGDATGYLSLGNRIKLTQTTVKYFVITAIGAYSGGVTPITLYGGTDYTLANAAITLPYFSTHKAPFGFPLDANKWDVVVTYATTVSQATPTQNVYYNLGTTNSQITVPIGLWDLSFEVGAQSASNAAQTQANIFVALSTSTSSVSNANLRGYLRSDGASGSLVISSKLYGKDTILLTSKTLHYLIALTNLTTCAGIYFTNGSTPMILRARFLYL